MAFARAIAAINATPWRNVPAAGLILACGLALVVMYFAAFGDGWVPLLDDANFAVHEAGHPLASLFGERLQVYGGTLAQLAFPAICMLEFWRRRWTVSYGLSAFWLGESLLNVARYVADARAMQLPLAGFSAHPLHDWNTILARWGLLHQDLALADGLRVLAWLVIAWALAFLLRHWSRSRARLAEEA